MIVLGGLVTVLELRLRRDKIVINLTRRICPQGVALVRSGLVELRNSSQRRAIVFIHGLQGDPKLSWRKFVGLLAAEEALNDWDIFSFGYSSFLALKALSIQFYTALKQERLAAYQQLAIMAHDLGGLIAQLALLDHEDLASRVSHAFFFASPNSGLRPMSFPLMQLLSGFPLLGRALGFIPPGEIHSGSVLLRNLNQRWNERFGQDAPFRYWSIAADRDSLVSVESLIAFSAEHRLIVSGDHTSLIRPDSRDAESAQIVFSALQDEELPNAPRLAAQGTIALESKLEAGEFDVFLHYSSLDSEVVYIVLAQLNEQGILPWLAEERVRPGTPWEESLMKIIDHLKAAIIFIGKSGPERWQKDEQAALIAEFSRRGLPVIPVFLPTCPPERSELSPPLSRLVAVDFRVPGTRPLEQLIWGIKGGHRPSAHPGPEKAPPVSVPPPASLLEVVRKRRQNLKMRMRLAIVAVSLLALGAWQTYRWIGCGNLFDPHIISRPGRNTAHYVREGNPDRVLVFVHGIFGNPEDTWTSPPDTYWPELIARDEAFRDTDIYVAAYDTGVGNPMTIDEVAGGLNQRFIDAGVFSKHRQVVLVCHSLGGLIVQRLLLMYRSYAKKVPLIYFYSTPQTGAQIARLGSIFSDDPLLREMAPGASNDYLRNIESEWRAAGFSIRRDCAYEKLKYKCVLVVDEMSSTRNCDSAVALKKNHVNIAKPADNRDYAYILLRNAWLELKR